MKVNRPDLCKQCGGQCCKETYFTMKEYARLCEALPDRVLGEGVVRPEGNGYISIGKCPALTETGCIWPYEERPGLCRTYPLIPFRTKQGITTLLLAIRTCPHWKEFGDHYKEQLEELKL